MVDYSAAEEYAKKRRREHEKPKKKITMAPKAGTSSAKHDELRRVKKTTIGSTKHEARIMPHIPGRGLGMGPPVERESAIKPGTPIKVLEGRLMGANGKVQGLKEMGICKLVVKFPWGNETVSEHVVTTVTEEEYDQHQV